MYIRSNHLQTISASCHNANDIEKANKLNLDFIFLSPVLYKKDSRKRIDNIMDVWNQKIKTS